MNALERCIPASRDASLATSSLSPPPQQDKVLPVYGLHEVAFRVKSEEVLGWE